MVRESKFNKNSIKLSHHKQRSFVRFHMVAQGRAQDGFARARQAANQNEFAISAGRLDLLQTAFQHGLLPFSAHQVGFHVTNVQLINSHVSGRSPHHIPALAVITGFNQSTTHFVGDGIAIAPKGGRRHGEGRVIVGVGGDAAISERTQQIGLGGSKGGAIIARGRGSVEAHGYCVMRL